MPSPKSLIPFIVFAAALAALALGPLAGQARAYSVNVVNNMPTDGTGLAVSVRWVLAIPGHEEFRDTGFLPAGQSKTLTFDGGQAGVCFYKFSWKIRRELPGCPAGGLQGHWHPITKGLVCRDVTVVVSRQGCAVRANH